jgi:DNA polymerase-1
MRAPPAQRGWDVTIVSSDKDLMQLVGTVRGGGRIDMLDTMKNLRIDIPEVVEKVRRRTLNWSATCWR